MRYVHDVRGLCRTRDEFSGVARAAIYREFNTWNYDCAILPDIARRTAQGQSLGISSKSRETLRELSSFDERNLANDHRKTSSRYRSVVLI
jgi:hypothetical protein